MKDLDRNSEKTDTGEDIYLARNERIAALAAKSEDERSVKIAGTVLVVKPGVQFRPEVWARYFDDFLHPDTHGLSNSETIELWDEIITTALEPESAGAWLALRAREDDPITRDDMLAVVRFVIEVQADRPTQPPSDSSDGRAPITTPSTDASPSPGVTPKV